MADQKAEEKRHAEMLEGLNKGIKEANGQMSDHELVLIKRAKKKKALGTISDKEAALLEKATPGAKTIKGAISDREKKLAEMEQ